MESANLESRERSHRLAATAPEVWASIAIGVIWLVVLFDAFWGPNFVSVNSGSTTTIPSAILFVPFAWLATRAIANRAFRMDGSEDRR
jgi:hypothetical protein